MERQACSIDPCFSYSASVVDDKVECIRSDGRIVQGKQPIFHLLGTKILGLILPIVDLYSDFVSFQFSTWPIQNPSSKVLKAPDESQGKYLGRN